jgi:hypothetical protein
MKLLAIFALLPIAVGPLPQEEQALTIELCLGGTIDIPLGDGEKEHVPDCHLDACHAGTCREKSKRSHSAD